MNTQIKEAMKGLRNDFEKVDKGERVDREIITFKLDEQESSLYRFIKALCVKGKEDKLFHDIVRHGLSTLTSEAIGLCKFQIMAENKGKFPFDFNLF